MDRRRGLCLTLVLVVLETMLGYEKRWKIDTYGNVV